MEAGSIRAFIGIALPPACQQQAERLGRAIAAIAAGPASPVRAATVHLTLKFLGDIPASGPHGIEAVTRALEGVVFAPFSLHFRGGGFFPDNRRPRVAWAGLDAGAGACQTLAAAVDAALTPLGIAPEARPYRPHLTLARLRQPGRDADWGQALRHLAEADWPVVPVTDFILWRSVLSPGGARHEPLARFSATGV